MAPCERGWEREAVVDVAVSGTPHRNVDCEHECRVAVFFGAPNQFAAAPSVPRDVDLNQRSVVGASTASRSIDVVPSVERV
jgi:hypothetical protein